MVRLHKDGDHMNIVTDANSEDQFIDEVSQAFDELIDSGVHEGDWAFQFRNWLSCIVDICNKYRGYKNNVVEKRLMCAGSQFFPDTPIEVEIKTDRCWEVK